MSVTGDGDGDAVGIGDGVGVAVGVGEGVTDGVGVAVGVGDGLGEAVGVGEGSAAVTVTEMVAILLLAVPSFAMNVNESGPL